MISRQTLHVVCLEVFKTALVLYVVFLGIDSILVGYVSGVFDTNILVGILLVSGLTALLTEEE